VAVSDAVDCESCVALGGGVGNPAVVDCNILRTSMPLCSFRCSRVSVGTPALPLENLPMNQDLKSICPSSNSRAVSSCDVVRTGCYSIEDSRED